jgi:hypothetical protein
MPFPKRFCILLCLFQLSFCGGYLFAQTAAPTKVVNPNWPDMRFKQELLVFQPDGSPMKRGYQQVSGSPYLLPACKKVTVYLTDIKQYVDVVGNLDLYSHELIFLDDKNAPLLVSEERISEFKYADTIDNKITFHKLINGYEPTGLTGRYDYFEVLIDGKISYLELKKVSLVESKNELTGEKNSIFEAYRDSFIQVAGKLIRLGKRQKETLLAAMEDKKDSVAAYVQKSRLTLRNNLEVMQLITYYNSL